jgi:hypothetical protein
MSSRKSEKVVTAMREFSDLMWKLYHDAEGLRDCTEYGDEKKVFNETRQALYDLKYKAKRLADKWENQSRLGSELQ